MGYYTNFELEVNAGPHDIKDIIEALKDIDEANYALGLEDYNFSSPRYFVWSGEASKWYSADRDMKEIAMQFPEAEFILYGEGEEREDVWMHKFVNDKMYWKKRVVTWEDWRE